MITTFGSTNICEQSFSIPKFRIFFTFKQRTLECSFNNINIQYESGYKRIRGKNIQPQKSH